MVWKKVLVLVVHTGKLIFIGISPIDACHNAITQALTDDPEMIRAINELLTSLF